MKKIIFYTTSLLTSEILILPFALIYVYGNIYSIEGLFSLNYYRNLTDITKLLSILTAVAVLVAIIIKCIHRLTRRIPELSVYTRLWNYTHTYKISFYRIKRYKWFFPVVTIMLSLIVIQSMMGTHHISYKMRWFENHHLVAHATGGIDNISYSNSLEAFEHNYEKGHRVFEIDFSLTADKILVAEHDWHSYYSKIGTFPDDTNTAPSHDFFMSNKLYNKYTPLDIKDIIQLLQKYDDTYIITDFKYCYDEELVKYTIKQIVDTTYEMECPELLNRIIVQVYHYEFLDWVNSVYNFDNYLFTCYIAPPSESEINNLVAFCDKNNIPVITMWTYLLNNENVSLSGNYNIRIYLHTENNLAAANEYINNGASGIYTDFLTPSKVILPEANQ